MDAGMAAVLGAGVGALGTALAAGMSGFWARSQLTMQLAAQERHQERQVRADHVSQLREPRRQAYASFLAETSADLEILQRVDAALSEDPPKREEAFEHLQSLHTPGLSTVYERVLLEGPEDVALAAAKVDMAMAAATDRAAEWLAHPDRGRSTSLTELLAQAQAGRVRFRFSAMHAIRADGGQLEVVEAASRARRMDSALSHHSTSTGLQHPFRRPPDVPPDAS
ncbi:hypothetical protein ACIO3O_22020 [Streptomyces sp. NPDC087440]|uniref:hypothetical protein n=1 Tax=Streptomyces sp. NPDC087440 TaxID=3365790 RepID=UPI0037F11448